MCEMIDQVQNNNFVFVLFFGIYKPESWTMFLEISPSNSIYIFFTWRFVYLFWQFHIPGAAYQWTPHQAIGREQIRAA